MPSLFPGMDPYLEQSAYWSAFHSRLIIALADAIEPTLNPDYYIEVETRTYLSDADDESLLSRSQHSPRADLYGIVLNQPLPSIPIPLKPNETEPVVHLQTVFDGIYDRARYANRVDYTQPLPPPKLSAADQQ